MLEKNFLKVNLSSIMFVLILVSSEKQPLMRVEQNKNNSNCIKVFVLEKKFLKVNLSSIMFVLILGVFSRILKLWRLSQANLHRTLLNAKGYPTMDFCLS